MMKLQLVLLLAFSSAAVVSAQGCSDTMAMDCVGKYTSAYKCHVTTFPMVMNDPCSKYINGSADDCLMSSCSAVDAPAVMSTDGFCSGGCHTASMVGNDQCDSACMTMECGLDGGDCLFQSDVSHAKAKELSMQFDMDGDMALNYSEYTAARASSAETMFFLPPMSMMEFGHYASMPDKMDDNDLLILMLGSVGDNITDSEQPMAINAIIYIGLADMNMDGMVDSHEAMETYGMDEGDYNEWGAWTVPTMRSQLADVIEVILGGAGEFDMKGGEDAEFLISLMDMNGDEMVTRLEAGILDLDGDEFGWMDTNHDGKLSEDEIASFLSLLGTKTCMGVKTIDRREGKIDTKAPLEDGSCSWIIQPSWFYKNPDYTPDYSQDIRKSAVPAHSATASLRNIKKNVGLRKREHAARKQTVSKRTVTGGAGTYAETDFVAQFMIDGMHKCSGALIHPNWIITSASCIMMLQTSTGSVGVEVGGVPSFISMMVTHPGFEGDGAMDIGLVKLGTPSDKKCAILYDGGDLGITDCYKLTMGFMGWNTSSMAYNKVPMRLVEQEQCEDRYELVTGHDLIGMEDMCVQAMDFAPGMGPECMGDIGGPLIARVPTHPTNKDDIFLIGLSNTAADCMGTGGVPLPSVFTRISPMLSWIYSVDPALGVHPAQMLKVTITSLGLPPGGELMIFKGSSYMGVPEILDSKCETPKTIMDDGAGALTIVYKMPKYNETIDCDEECARSMGFEAEYETMDCEDLDEMSCPMVDGCMLSMETPPKCMKESMCKMSLGWETIGPMEDMGKAFTGGLGKRAMTSAEADYGVWSCARDWNSTEQVNCGAKHGEFACFWFNERNRMWDFKGLNQEARLVRDAQIEKAYMTEFDLLDGKTLATSPEQASPAVMN